jgi:site-specific DNA-methyltransferase (adenine-specific)
MKTRSQIVRIEVEPRIISAPRLTTTHGVLFNADCLTLLPLIKSESVHAIFADPPFNLGKDYKNGFDDSWEGGDYFEWSFRWIDECCRVLAQGGAFFLYALPRLAFRFAAQLDGKLEFRHWIALSMKGTFPRGDRLYPAHYALLYFTKGEPRTFTKLRVPISVCRECGAEIKDYGGYRSRLHPDGISLSDFWDDTSPNRHKKSKSRPGVNELKPVIPSRAIELSTKAGDIVLDPFGGGGSTYQEAQRLGRFWIGSELGDCSPIAERFKSFAPTTVGRKPPKRILNAVINELDFNF